MKTLLKISLLLVILSQQSACSYRNNIKEVVNEERKTLQITNHTEITKADFLTYSEVLGTQFGVVGAIISSMGSNGVIAVSNVNDPANDIKRDLGEILKSKYNLTVIEGAKDVIGGDDILTNYAEGDLILDVNSVVGGVYYPFRFNNFRTSYTAFSKLIDRKTDSIIFMSTCSYNNTKNNDNTLKEIAENPQIIIDILKGAKEFCLDKLSKEIVK